MLNIIGKQALTLQVIKSQRPACKQKWCEEELRDAERIFEMVENIIELAVASSHSPQNYANLQQAKADFIQEFIDTSRKYRLIDPVGGN